MILAIIQARSSSSRLPGKVLKPILGKPMIIHELERLQRSKRIDKIVLATSQDKSDDALADIVVKSGVEVYRGSLDDVLDRYYQCAKAYQPTHVVRITGDCPVIDWRVVDAVIKKHLEERNDYTNETGRFPDGLDTEVFLFSALKIAWENANLMSEREHVTLYIKNHPESFKIGKLDSELDLSRMRWTVDEPQDLELIQQIYGALYLSNTDFAMQDILRLFERQPELFTINQGIQRNEGLLKSLREDKELEEGN